MTRIVCLSDTHNLHRSVDVPEGDVLVFAGDLTGAGTQPEVVDFLRWFEALPHPSKVMIAGNHDWLFERDPGQAAQLVAKHAPSATYLKDSGALIAGLRFWGSPVQPRFLDWAFNRDRGADIQRHWDLIPANTEVLVSHGPPRGYLDHVPNIGQEGCANLRATLGKLPELRLSVFGHLHSKGGKMMMDSGKIFVNASICDERYRPIHRAVMVAL